ncbi:MAG: response regulator [Blautia sp.]|nr:response regulator [Blautia sp.]
MNHSSHRFPGQKSIQAFLSDPSLLEKTRELILYGIAMNEYDLVLLIETSTGLALPLHSNGSDLPLFDRNGCFDYDQNIRTFLNEYCTDIDPEEIIRKSSLPVAIKHLQTSDHYSVSFRISLGGSQYLHKKLIWHKLSVPRGFLTASIVDMTEDFLEEDERRSRLEAALKQAQANLDANNSFLSLVSRDIRTPLHSIIGLSQMANAELMDISAVESYLYKISMSGTYMEDTINDIRDFIRISWHPIELREEIIDLPVFLSSASRFLSRRAAQRNLHFFLHTDNISQKSVLTDLAALRQVLVKFTDNMINYTLRGGTIDMHFSSETISQEEAQVRLSVQSRGIDLNPGRLGVLLKPFEDIMEEVRSNISSIDMDLVILKAYVDSLKGKISIQNNEGISTGIEILFHFPLPHSDSRVSSLQPVRFSQIPALDLPVFTGKRALLADDDSINLEVGSKMLEKTGMTVFQAHNGAQALNLFIEEDGDFDVILMDIRMPVMNGLEASKRIRGLTLPAAGHIPIIALTVNAFDEDYTLSLEAGIDRHLTKPIEPGSLYQILKELL